MGRQYDYLRKYGRAWGHNTKLTALKDDTLLVASVLVGVGGAVVVSVLTGGLAPVVGIIIGAGVTIGLAGGERGLEGLKKKITNRKVNNLDKYKKMVNEYESNTIEMYRWLCEREKDKNNSKKKSRKRGGNRGSELILLESESDELELVKSGDGSDNMKTWLKWKGLEKKKEKENKDSEEKLDITIKKRVSEKQKQLKEKIGKWEKKIRGGKTDYRGMISVRDLLRGEESSLYDVGSSKRSTKELKGEEVVGSVLRHMCYVDIYERKLLYEFQEIKNGRVGNDNVKNCMRMEEDLLEFNHHFSKLAHRTRELEYLNDEVQKVFRVKLPKYIFLLQCADSNLEERVGKWGEREFREKVHGTLSKKGMLGRPSSGTGKGGGSDVEVIKKMFNL